MVTDDFSWPQLVLPLKRWTHDRVVEHAYLCDPVPLGHKVMIYVGNMWAPNPKKDPAILYDSVDAFIEAGWEVD
jgi:hypothetical protein